MAMLNPVTAALLLIECRGDEIWSRNYCLQRGIPEVWIDELEDAFESGFQTRQQTIYSEQGLVNQYAGCRDLDLAFKLAEYLGVDTLPFRTRPGSPTQLVRWLQEAYEEE